MTKILTPLSAEIVACDETRVLDRVTREEFFVEGADEKNVSCAYEVFGEVKHEVFIEVKQDASCVVNILYRAHEKGANMHAHISVLLHAGARISLDVASVCENIACESDVRVFVVFNEASRATVRAFTHASAPRSVVHEEIRGLIVEASAHASFIPEVSLLHDDIVATHATSITKIDEKHVAYLQSRGALREDAVRCLSDAFLGVM